jgi:metal-responsive CopG/Arc/MetJ family transcriptional regulator
MSNVTVNISFQDSLLAEIDAEATRESRSRSELLREAARGYIRRQRQWDAVFTLGDTITSREQLTEADVERAIRSVRSRRAKTS